MRNEKSYGPRKGPRGRAIFQKWAEEEKTLPGPEEELSGRMEIHKCSIKEAVVGSLSDAPW